MHCTATSRRAENLQTFRSFTPVGALQPISQTHFALFTSSMNKRNENICRNVNKTVYCVTIIMLEQLNAPELCKESTESNENYVKLNVILHQKSKFLHTIVCCLVVTQCSNQNKNLEKLKTGDERICGSVPVEFQYFGYFNVGL